MSINVSIIVPVFNSEKYLNRCLNSLVNQSLKEIEIILINDCSSDKSLSILNSYKQQYQNKVIVKNLLENSGPGGARNLGLEIAQGEYIGFVDSDDDVSLNMFEKLFKIAKRANYDMVDCYFYAESLNKNVHTTPKETLGELNLEKRKLFIMNSGYIWSKIIKRDIILNNNIKFREKVAYEDSEFLRLAILYCQKICATNMILYNYRLNNTSITSSYSTKVHVFEKIEAMKSLVQKFKNLHLYEDYRDEITYLIYETYSNMIQTSVALEKTENINVQLFKTLHDFFFEIIDYDYSDNKYIAKISEQDRLFAEVNNNDYTTIISQFPKFIEYFK